MPPCLRGSRILRAFAKTNGRLAANGQCRLDRLERPRAEPRPRGRARLLHRFRDAHRRGRHKRHAARGLATRLRYCRARVGARFHTIERRETSGEPPRAIWDVGVALFREALVSEKTRFDDDTHTSDPSTLSEHRARALAAAEARNLSAENLPVGEPTLSSANANAARVGTAEKRSRVDGASNLDATRLASRGVSRLIERERDGGSRDARGLTRRATRAFVALGFYRETFEPMFLESAAARYAREGDELRSTLDPFAYARHCETRLREEAAMCAGKKCPCSGGRLPNGW